MQQTGLKLSSPNGSSLTVSLIGEASSMSAHPISTALHSVIFSLGSEAGPSPSVAPAGLTLDLFGREVVPVSRSRSRARAKASPTIDTSGQSGTSSSASDALQRSLESRLRARLRGSDLCEVIWKPWATPWGQSLSRPRARVRTTFGTGFGSWPTPTSRDHKDGKPCPNVPVNGLLGRMVWPTPTSLAKAKDGNNEAGNSAGLVAIRKHALWATARASPNENRTTKATPSQMAGKHGAYLAVQAIISNGPSEQTEKPGALNPEFVCWLMGYPPEWLSCAPSATRSTRGRQRSSSVRAPDVAQTAGDRQ